MKHTRSMQAISAETNIRVANVKRNLRNLRGRSQNRLHVQKALMEYFSAGKKSS